MSFKDYVASWQRLLRVYIVAGGIMTFVYASGTLAHYHPDVCRVNYFKDNMADNSTLFNLAVAQAIFFGGLAASGIVKEFYPVRPVTPLMRVLDVLFRIAAATLFAAALWIILFGILTASCSDSIGSATNSEVRSYKVFAAVLFSFSISSSFYHNLPLLLTWLPKEGSSRQAILGDRMTMVYTNALDITMFVSRFLLATFAMILIVKNDDDFFSHVLNSQRTSDACKTALANQPPESWAERQFHYVQIGTSTDTEWSTGNGYKGIVYTAEVLSILVVLHRFVEFLLVKFMPNTVTRGWFFYFKLVTNFATLAADVFVDIIIYVTFMENVIASCPIYNSQNSDVYNLHVMIVLYIIVIILQHGYDQYLTVGTDSAEVKSSGLTLNALVKTSTKNKNAIFSGSLYTNDSR